MKTKQQIIHYVMNGLEGKYDNDPDDSGGETFWGVTADGWGDYIGDDSGEAEWPVPQFDKDMAYLVYAYYWDKMEIDLLPNDMQLMVFAFGFNAGRSRAIRYMQESLGLSADGIIGPQTRGGYSALCEMEHSDTRFRFASRVVKGYMSYKKFEKFGFGWINRLLKTMVMS